MATSDTESGPESPETSGHVFVVRGDIKTLHCDAWMLPTDARFQVSASWTDVVGMARPGRLDLDPWGPGERARPHPTDSHPNVWLAETAPVAGASSWEELCDFHLSGVESFVRTASAHVSRSALRRRLRLAVPLVGTGAGGRARRRGLVLKAWFAHLHQLAVEADVDVATVCWDPKDYAAAQRARLDVLAMDGSDQPGAIERALPYWDFGDRTALLHRHARRLARLCSEGHLALFLGAGVSAGAGLPTWTQLLELLDSSLDDEALGLRSDAELSRSFDLRDLAALLERRFDKAAGGGTRFAAAVATELDSPHHSLQHALVASLPANEIITTNFDRLFELAATAANQRLSVLPGSPVEGSDRWLLKIHGSVDTPDTMVLTRSGYLSAPRQWGALFGLVQAMLLTRHMLFLGYSLTDEDFNEVVHEVRLALPASAHPRPLGTAITLFEDRVMAELWENDVEVVSVRGRREEEQASLDDAARDVDRLLDLMGFLAADTAAFILDEDYADMLNTQEHELRRLLTRLAEDIPSAVSGPGWERLRTLLAELGRP